MPLLANLKASVRGCKIPLTLTLLGPKRRPTSPKNLRSKRVKNAIETRTGMRIRQELMITIFRKLGL